MQVNTATQCLAAAAIADRSAVSIPVAATLVGAVLPLLDTPALVRRTLAELLPSAAADAAVVILLDEPVAIAC